MSTDHPDGELRRLQDHQEIRDLVAAYCRGVDRLDLAAVRAVYTRDGIDHHTGFDGSADEYVAWLGRLLPRLGGTMHIVGNQLVELHGEEAVCESYGTAVHWGEPADDARLNFTSGFRYVDHLVREDGAWRVRERWAVREWTRSDAGRRVASEAEGPRPDRGPQDPLRRLQARFS